MCGILGSINRVFNEKELDLIQHRGPDDFGIENYSVNNNTIVFGQRRLSIIDLSPAGHQPMNSMCDDYSIIFNGEIYNHLELREKLPSTTKYKGHSDTETILYYLKEFGIDGIKDFNGIFAIAFLDKKKKKLFLARDPFGVKPLYYHQDGNSLIFSSEIRPIKSMVGSETLNNKALASLLRLRYNASSDTLYNNIKKMLPGHCCEIDLNDKNLNPTHSFYAKKLPVEKKESNISLLHQYGFELEKAVKRQLISDVEVGILLSGGIDSAVVAALAKKHYKGRLKAFTIGFEGQFEEDEIKDAQVTAEFLGLEHHVKKITFSDFLELIEECTKIVEEPLATTSMIPMYYLSKLASEKVKVVLTGQGADEPLGGYTRYKSEIVRQKIPRIITKLILPIVKILKIKNEKLLRGANSLAISDELNRFLAVYEIFSNDEIKKLISVEDSLSRTRINYFYDTLDCKSKKQPIERMMAIDSRMNLADDLLNYTDKITMNFSMECRVPMLDIELIDFIESIPLHLKVNYNQGKLIHKEFAKTILPSEIINRPKKGFKSPTKIWFEKESEKLKDILLSPNSEFSKVFNQSYVSEIILQHQRGYNKEKQIFLLLSIYYWLKSKSNDLK